MRQSARTLVLICNFIVGDSLSIAAAFQLYDLALGLPYPDPQAVLPAKALLPFSCLALYALYKASMVHSGHKHASVLLGVTLNFLVAIFACLLGNEVISNIGKNILNPFEVQSLILAAVAAINVVALIFSSKMA